MTAGANFDVSRLVPRHVSGFSLVWHAVALASLNSRQRLPVIQPACWEMGNVPINVEIGGQALPALSR